MTNDEVQGRHTHRSQIAANAEVEARIPPDRTAVAVPDDPDAARAEIEMTRARMSETIDEIEEALLRKKEKIQDRLDVFGPVRERPLPAAGLVFGAGLLLGLLTGGDDEDDYEDDHDYEFRRSGRYGSRLRELEERADTWEHRARQLLDIAREQEEELDRVTGGEYSARSEEWHGEDEHEHEDGSSSFDGLRDKLVSGMTGFVAHAVQDVIRSTISERTR